MKVSSSAKVRLVKDALFPKERIREILLKSRLEERDLISLHKMLRPEKEGGIAQGERGLRKEIWEKIIEHSFGKKEIPKVNKEDLPYRGRIGQIERLGHVLLLGKLNKSGHLEAGELFGHFPAYPNEDYLLEMRGRFPLRIFFERDSSAFEFFPVINKVGETIAVHRGKVKRENFLAWGEFTTFTYLTPTEGLLFLGPRPGLTRGIGKANRPWAKFVDHPDEKVKVEAKEGVILRCSSLESDLRAEFSLVWDKSRGKYVTSFWERMREEEFNQLTSDHELHCLLLDKDGVLRLGGRTWVDFGPSYSYYQAKATEILNPAGEKAFLKAVQVVQGEQVLTSKSLSCLYAVRSGEPPESFARGELLEVFEKLREEKLKKVPDCILAGIRIPEGGELCLGGCYLGRFPHFRGYEVEVKVIAGRPAFIKFVADEKGCPVYDVQGKPLVRKVGSGLRLEEELKTPEATKKRVAKLRDWLLKAEELLKRGEKKKARYYLRKFRRLAEKLSFLPEVEKLIEEASRVVGERKLEEGLKNWLAKAKELLGKGEKKKARYCLKRFHKLAERIPSHPEVKELTEEASKLVENMKLEERKKKVEERKELSKNLPIRREKKEKLKAKAPAEKPKVESKKSEEPSKFVRLLDALLRKGVSLDWVVKETGISKGRILSLLRKGEEGSEEEIKKLMLAGVKSLLERNGIPVLEGKPKYPSDGNKK
jgi:hypothetical protein